MIKTLSTWFTRDRLALANGVLSMSMAVGFMLGSMISATILSPALGGWRNVLFFYGAFALIAGILWLFSRSMPDDAVVTDTGTATVPFKKSLAHVARTKRVWLLALIMLGQIGCVQGTLGYLPVYLRDIGWSEAARKVEAGLEKTFASKKVTYDLARLMDGAEEVSCSGFADIVCGNME